MLRIWLGEYWYTEVRVAINFKIRRTILGSTSLAMAYAAHNCGIALFVVLLGAVGMMAEQSIMMLTEGMNFAKVHTFPALGLAAAGPIGEYAVVLAVMIQQLGADIAYVQIVGTVITPLVSRINGGHGLLADPRFWQVAVAVCIMLPLCMLPRINSLRFSSIASVVLILLFNVVVVLDGAYQLGQSYSAAESTEQRPHGIEWSNINFGPDSAVDVLLALPILAFAQVCQMNVFPVVSELKDPTAKRISAISKGSIGLTWVVYVLSGVFGYFAFGNNIDSNIIQSYEDMQDSDDPSRRQLLVPRLLVQIMQFAIGLALTLAYPVVTYELRHSAEFLLAKHQPFNWWRHSILNVCIVAVSTTVAILVPQITKVFGFTGATTSCFVVFILPAYYFLRVAPGTIASVWRKKAAVVVLATGCVLVPACLAVQIMKASGY